MRYWCCFLCFIVILIIHIKHLFTLFLNFYLQSTLNCSMRTSIVVWRHQATPTYSVQRYAACREVVSYERRKLVFLGKNCSPCAGVTCQGNHFQFIPAVSMESQHCTGVPTCHDFPRFLIISEKSRPEVQNLWLWSSKNGVFLEKRPLTGKVSQMFSKTTHADTETRLFVQISWNLADRKWVKSCVI